MGYWVSRTSLFFFGSIGVFEWPSFIVYLLTAAAVAMAAESQPTRVSP